MKILKKIIGISLLIMWFAPAAVLLFDTFAWLLTGHAPSATRYRLMSFSVLELPFSTASQ